jgi:cell division ATPase FtsA
LAQDSIPSSETPRRVIIGLDMGAESSTLVISAADRVWFRSIGAAGDEYSRAMTRTLRRSMEEIEQLKPRIGDMSPVHPLYQQFDAITAQLRDRIERSLDDARRLLGRLAPVGAWCTGGSCLLPGTLDRLFYRAADSKYQS